MPMDKLDELFSMQKNLEVEVLAKPENLQRYGLTPEERVRHIATAIMHESVELQRLTDYKWWKKYKGFDEAAAREELIDIAHFVVQGALALNMTPDMLLAEYKQKMGVNHNRVETGY